MAEIRLFQNSKDFQVFPAGHVIFQENDTGDVMYVVIGGQVDILVRGKVMETVGEGGIIGELALIDRQPRSGSAIARTECKLVPINRDRFMFMVQETPNFALHVMQIMADRLRRMNAQV